MPFVPNMAEKVLNMSKIASYAVKPKMICFK
jgi:hypothetical protein